MNEEKYVIPYIEIYDNSQKGTYKFSDILTPEILKDVCFKTLGTKEYEVKFIEKSYNKGRLAIIYYKQEVVYISFSENGEIKGRNSFFQSLTTAVTQYYNQKNPNKRICYYFLPLKGNIETDYFKFMYRLMATINVEFLNDDLYLKERIEKFNSLQDLIRFREKNKGANKANNATYITKGENSEVEIYAKTYGANKKEAVLITMAVSNLCRKIKLFEISEKDLVELPKGDKKVLQQIGNIEIVSTDFKFEEKQYENNNSLRSVRYIYNLLEKLGPKKCVLCSCNIPEIIQGAHIWAVADIKKEFLLKNVQKVEMSTDGENGIWLCANHHKLFDEHLISFNRNGEININANLDENAIQYIKEITTVTKLSTDILSENFLVYLSKRNIQENLQF